MEEETNLAVDETPEVESVPVADEPEVELDETGQPIEAEPEEDLEPEFADVEYEGKTYKVPPELKDAVLRQADYTRKTQEVADMRRQVETTLQAVQTVSQAERQAEVDIGVLDTQIHDYHDIDWDTWEQTDPVAAQRGWRQLQQLQQRRDQAVNRYQQAVNQRTLLTQQEAAKRIEQGVKELTQRIPDWTPDKARTLIDFGSKAYGFTPADFNDIDDPRVVQVLYDAWQYRNASKPKPAAAPPPVPQIKPAAKVATGKPAIRPTDDRASIDAWMKARSAQLSKR